MRCRLVISTSVVFALALAAGRTLAEPAADTGKWRKMEQAGFIIEYQSDMEDLARRLMPEIIKRVEKTDTPQSMADLETLIKHKDEVLRFIMGQLGMSKPGENTRITFEQFPAVLHTFQSIRYCQHFKIWHKEELVKLLKSGYQDPWLTYEPATDSIRFGKYWTDWKNVPEVDVLPLIIEKDSTYSAFEQAVYLLDFHQEMARTLPSAALVCHETAEVAMGEDLEIRGAFRRWFCEGAADYIAAACVEKLFGKAASTEYLKPRHPTLYKDLRNQVDLLRWRAPEWQTDMPTMDDRLGSAHYAYAAREVFGLAKRHGPEVIPTVFKEISKSEIRDGETILNAIKKVTGEDIRAVLEEYGAESKDRLRGLAIRHVKLGTGERLADKQCRMTQETTTIPLTSEGKHGIIFTFWYAAADPPVTVKCECTTPRKPDGHSEVETYSLEVKERVYGASVFFSFEEGYYMPGDASIRLFLNEHLVKELPFKLVPASPPTGSTPPASQPADESRPPR